jgi:hypothetical protein
MRIFPLSKKFINSGVNKNDELRYSPMRTLLHTSLKPASIASPALRMLTPHIRPSNPTPAYSTPVGVITVLGTIGRWFRPSSTYESHPKKKERINK